MKTLQIGLEWMPERAGGVPRYYYDLWKSAGEVFDFRGLVIGSANVETSSGGRVIGFAPASDPLPIRLLKARSAYARLTSDWHPDVVVSHFALTTLPLVSLIDRPMVLQFHGPWAHEGIVEGNRGLRFRAKKWVEDAIYRRASRAITLSKAFADVLANEYGFPADAIDVVPGGVDVARFDIAASRQEARERLGWPKDRPIVVAVRRLVRRMGLENLVEAAEMLKRRNRDVLIKIAGKGALSEKLAEMIAERGLSDTVELLGFVSDDRLPLVYRAADLSIVPTQALEGFGLIALEALAAGTPVIVSPVGGLPEVVSGLDDRLVLASGSVEDIAAGIESALFDGAVPGAAACLAHAQKCDWPIIAEKLADCYRKAL